MTKQPEGNTLQPLKLLAQERHKPDLKVIESKPITAQFEPFSQMASELLPLFERHYKELFDGNKYAPLEPDWETYFWLEARGRLHINVARCDDVLVGYIINVLGRHLFSRNAIACDIEKFYLDPAYRGSGFAVRWFKDNDKHLKELGVKWVAVSVKNNFNAGRVGSLFRRLGYSPIETVWMRGL